MVCLCLRDHETHSIMKKTSVTVNAEEENTISDIHSTALQSSTVRRPGSCSVERSQQLIAQIHSHIQYASLQSGKQGCLQKSRVMIVKTGLIYTSDHGSQGRKGKSHCFCCKLRPYSVKLRAAGFLSGHHQTFNLNRFPKKFSKQMSPTTPQRHINNY